LLFASVRNVSCKAVRSYDGLAVVLCPRGILPNPPRQRQSDVSSTILHREGFVNRVIPSTLNSQAVARHMWSSLRTRKVENW
jgi:hypothetical protein